MATTTLSAIINQIESDIIAITPETKSDLTFDRSPRDLDIRLWAVEDDGSSAVTRKFQVMSNGAASEEEFLHPEQIMREELLTITVAYYVPEFWEDQDRADTADVVRRDTAMIRDAVFSTGNHVEGHQASWVTFEGPDREADGIWFQDIDVRVRYNEAQSLT